MEKIYHEQQLRELYDSYDCIDQRAILFNALDIMQQYNGRSKWTCIFMAMGYKLSAGMSDYWIKE